MTEQIKEQISALLDGELSPGELDLLLRRMERDENHRRTFGRYALVGELLRAPGGTVASVHFTERVITAVETGHAQPAEQRPRVTAGHRWLGPALGAAVAASALVIAVVLVRPEAGPGAQTAAAVQPAASRATLDLEQPFIGGASPTPARSQRLATYLVAHGEYASAIGRRNVWTGVLANDPGMTRVSYEVTEAR